MATDHDEELFKTWMANEGVRDPRELDVARRRAFGLPDDAPRQALGEMLAHTPDVIAAVAEAEREYQLLRAEGRAPQDPVALWLIGQRDLEAPYSKEWWALDRVARKFQAQCPP